ncbi:MAG: YceD family protein [Formosimonas sp.]
MSTLTIDVFNLTKNSGEYAGQLPINALSRMQSDLLDTAGALTYRVVGEPKDLLHIDVAGALHMTCQRCLEALIQTIDVHNTVQIVASEAELDSEEEELDAILKGIEAPEKIVGAKEFDLLNFIEDEVILSLPFSVAHEVCPVQLPTSSGQKTSAFDVLAKLK